MSSYLSPYLLPRTKPQVLPDLRDGRDLPERLPYDPPPMREVLAERLPDTPAPRTYDLPERAVAEPPVPVNRELKERAGAYAEPPRMLSVKEAATVPEPRVLAPPPVREISMSGLPERADRLVYKNGVSSEMRILPEPVAQRLAAPAGRAPLPPLRAYSPSYGAYEDARDALPTEKRYLEERRPKGFGQRLLSGVKTAGKALLATGNPLHAITGGVVSAFDPDAEARLTYRAFVEPREQARQGLLLDRAGKELGLRNVIEDNEARREALDQQRDNQAYARDLREREYLQGEREFRFRVNKFIYDAEQAQRQARTAQEKAEWQQKIDQAQLFLETGTEIPGWLADAVNAPELRGATKDLRERETPFSVYEAEADTPETYGVKNWSDLVANPNYQTEYNAAYARAKRISDAEKGTSYARTPEQVMAEMEEEGKLKLPPERIPASELRRENPSAVRRRAADLYNQNRQKKPQRRGGRVGSKGSLSARQVDAYAKASGLTTDQAKTYLRSDGYKVE